MRLSVLMPVYNERTMVERSIALVLAAPLPENMERELVVVDDQSSDGTWDILQRLAAGFPQIHLYRHEQNRGKGAAVRTAIDKATGDFSLVQDADLEYDPADYFKLIAPIEAENADVVYGSRFLGGPQRVLLFWHYAGNRFLTVLSDMVTDINLSDVWTCYKAFRREVLQDLDLRENRFGFEQEFTIKMARRGWRVYEVPISYYGRTYAEGKKITWKDGVGALWCILRYGILSGHSEPSRQGGKHGK